MNGKMPHIVQYQGSKRILAPQILRYMPQKFDRLIEPFAGMAAITIAVAKEGRAERYVINDVNEPIVRLLQTAVDRPDYLIDRYSNVWAEQFEHQGGHIEHFYHIRDSFNGGEQTPENVLYLLARCVKGSVRYGRNGNFNQSPDKRRHGTAPKNVAKNVYEISALLRGKVTFSAVDYGEVLETAEPGDLVYMDPPYQGVSSMRDNRYLAGVGFDDFSRAIRTLDERGIEYIISYDGECGGKGYGNELPSSLNCAKFLLDAGLSTQATLLGKRNITYEALYVSNDLVRTARSFPKQVSLAGQTV
ncbi:MAG: DNA adenine methylase [Methanomassiliicoccaceae archaeon]|nr:DNA adenine methylase [Methanomassiliicoccaceae archaeon]